MRHWIVPAFFLVVFALAGCDNPQRTIDDLRKEIAAFKAAPDEKKQAVIEAQFAKLEEQINETATKDSIKADLLRRQYAGLQGEYQAAKLARTINDAKNALQGLGEAFKEGAKSFGETLKSSGTTGD